MSKKILMAFGSHHISKGFPRFVEQAESMNIFDGIKCFSEKDLDNDFKKLWGRYLVKYSRGYGHWCWKTYLLLQVLESMNDGDILLYLDIGCFLNPAGRDKLLEYYKMVEESETGILGTQSQVKNYNGMPETLYYENNWTKGDVFEYFGVREDKKFTHTTQFESGIIFFKKSPLVMQFVKEWQQAYLDDYSLATDSPSKTKNFPEFIENRHDQSIYSILCKQYKVSYISTNETFQQEDWSLLDKYPIHARRDKAYPSKWHYRFRFRIRRFYQIMWKVKYFFKDLFCGVHDKQITP